MKYMNAIITVIIAAAVLIAAYAIGLLVRQARIPDNRPSPRAVAAPNEVTPGPAVVAPGPGLARVRAEDTPTPEEIRQQQEELLEKSKNMTEEQKEQLRQQVRSRFVPQADRRRIRGLSPEERRDMLQKWQNMSLEERKAREARMVEASRTVGRKPPETEVNAPEGDGAATEQGTEQGAVEPNEPDRVEP